MKRSDMNATTAETSNANAYLRTRVMTASPEELRLMLLEGAIKFAHQGREGLLRKDYEASYNGLTQCRNIVLELLGTMRPEFDPELCDRLKGLYTFMFTELVEASLSKTPDRVDAVIKLLDYERETWVMLIRQLGTERAAGTPPAATAEPKAARAPLSVNA